jgi:hypothetical protein
MFYCSKCRDENGWPDGLLKSFGNCEVCGERAECCEVASSALPVPERPINEKYVDALQKAKETLDGFIDDNMPGPESGMDSRSVPDTVVSASWLIMKISENIDRYKTS